MLRRSPLLGSLALAILAGACAEQPAQPVAPEATAAPLSLYETPAVDRTTLARPFGTLLDLQPTGVVARAIDPGDYACSTDSPINGWLGGEIMRSLTLEPTRFMTVYNLAGDLIATYEALIFQTSDTPQSFGIDGRHTHAIRKAERDLKVFWDIPSSDIQAVAMHGDVLRDTIRTARTYAALGVPLATARAYARALRDAVVGSRTMANHPFVTFNAFAFTTGTAPTAIPDKIVMGDGILLGYDALGFGDVAPQAIFAHEFAHHVQFENGYGLESVDAAERARFNELGADAMAAYWLTHARGAAMNRKRVEQFLAVFFQIGDCAFADPGHHGTPNQRLAAARFGFELAAMAQKQGQVMQAEKVQMAFILAYPGIVAPDAQ